MQENNEQTTPEEQVKYLPCGHTEEQKELCERDLCQRYARVKSLQEEDNL